MPSLHASRSARTSKSRKVVAAAVEGLERRQMLCGLDHEKLIEAPEWSDAVEQQYAAAREGGPEAVSIVWSNRGQTSDGFASAFGTSAAAGRLVVDAALRHWERIITSFNRSDGTSTLQVNVSMDTDAGFGGTGAPAGTAPSDGKPRTGSFQLSLGIVTANANDSNGWYFDPTPDDWSEYDGGILNAYAGNALTSPGPDFYSVAVAEMAHVLGLIADKNNDGAAWNGYRLETSGFATPTNPLQRDNAEGGGSFGHFWLFDGPNVDHLMTSYNGGDATSTSWGNVVHTAGSGGNINQGGVNYRGAEDGGNAAGNNERTLPSWTVAQILADAYGYTIVDPEMFGTMHASLNTSNGVLTIRGSSSATSSDLIILNQDGSDVLVSVDIGEDVAGTGPLAGAGNIDAYVTRFPRSSVNSIVINGGGGTDYIRIEDSAGRPVQINGEGGNDFIDFAFYSQNLTNIDTTSISVSGGPGFDQLFCYDNANNTTDPFTITSARFDRAGWAGFFYSSDIEALNLTTGTAANTVNVQSTFANGAATQPVYLFSAGGSDTVNIGNSVNGVRGINADVTVYNNPSTTTLNINNGPDTGARTWNVDAVGDLGYLVGMAPARIYWDNADISSINLTCGSGLDTGQFVISSETFNINNTGGNDIIRIGVPAAQGLQLISGQITIDNTPALTTLTIDDTGSFIPRTLTIDEGGGYNTIVGFGPLIRFDSVDTNNTTIITSGVGDTVNVVRNDETLILNSAGGNDTINLGNTTNGVALFTDTLTVRNTPSTSTVNINNGPDTTARAATLQTVSNGVDIFGQWTGLALGIINYRYLDVSTVNVTFGSAVDTINVRASQKNLNFTTTAGNDVYTIGGAADGAQSVLGEITLQNPPSRNVITVDDAGDTVGRVATIAATTISGNAYTRLTGLAPATINWRDTDASAFNITHGSGSDALYLNQFYSTAGITVLGGNGDDELFFGNGNVAANIAALIPLRFDGQGGTADKFILNNAAATIGELWNYGIDDPGITASRIVGGVYNHSIAKQNVEQSVINADRGDDNLVVTAVATGQSVVFNAGEGADTIFLPVNVSTAIRGPITIDGQSGPGDVITHTSNSSTAATTLHVTATNIGGFAGDNFFGPGGSVQFSNLTNILLTLGSGADTVYATPNATAGLNIRGGNPTTAPGDRIDFGLAGVVGASVNGPPANGTVTSTNRKTLIYSAFESGQTIDNVAPAVNSTNANLTGIPRPGGAPGARQALTAQFSENVSGLLNPGSISVLNLDNETPVPAANIAVEYVAGTNTAQFVFPGYAYGALPDGNYSATILSGLPDFFGNGLPGSTGFAAFFFLNGDANRDRSVNIDDFSVLAGRFNQPGNFGQGDFTFDGITNIDDFSVLASKFNRTLPAPAPLPRSASEPSSASFSTTRIDVEELLEVA